jgi:hypothetical protein
MRFSKSDTAAQLIPLSFGILLGLFLIFPELSLLALDADGLVFYWKPPLIWLVLLMAVMFVAWSVKKKYDYDSRTGKDGDLSAYLLMGSFFLFTLLSLFYHEPWGDEAQAWLLARDSGSRFFQQLGYEGSPGLWHLLLFLPAKAGAPYITEQLLHLLIVNTAAAILIFRAPFSLLLKAALLFSFYLAFEYAWIARSYALSMLLLFFIAANWHKVTTKPLMPLVAAVLLMNTNLHSAAAAFALLVLMFFKQTNQSSGRNKQILTAVLALISIIVCILQIWPAADNSHHNITAFLRAPFYAVSSAFIPRPDSWMDQMTAADLLFVPLVLCYFLWLWLNHRGMLFFLSVSFCSICILFVFFDPGSSRHHGFLLFFIITSLWISSSGNEVRKVRMNYLKRIFVTVLFFFLLLSTFTAVAFMSRDIRENFCGSRDMAAYISANVSGDDIIIAHRGHPAIAVLPDLPGRRFWYPDRRAYGTYVIWNRSWAAAESMNLQDILRNGLPDAKAKIWILLDDFVLRNSPEDPRLKLMFSSEAFPGSYGSGFSIYLYRENHSL